MHVFQKLPLPFFFHVMKEVGKQGSYKGKKNAKISWSKHFKEQQSNRVINTACMSPNEQKPGFEWGDLRASLERGISASPPINSAGEWRSSVQRYQVAFSKKSQLKTAQPPAPGHAANMGRKYRREILWEFFSGLCKLKLIKCHKGVLLPAKWRICVFIHIMGMSCRKPSDLTRWNRRSQRTPFAGSWPYQ